MWHRVTEGEPGPAGAWRRRAAKAAFDERPGVDAAGAGAVADADADADNGDSGRDP